MSSESSTKELKIDEKEEAKGQNNKVILTLFLFNWRKKSGLSPISLSIEGFQRLYKKKKELKNRKEKTIENAHTSNFFEYQDIISQFYLDLISSVVVTSDNKLLVSASYDRSIKIFNMDTKEEFCRFIEVHKGKYIS